MLREILQQLASSAAAMGSAILQGMEIERPLEVVKAAALLNSKSPIVLGNYNHKIGYREIQN